MGASDNDSLFRSSRKGGGLIPPAPIFIFPENIYKSVYLNSSMVKKVVTKTVTGVGDEKKVSIMDSSVDADKAPKKKKMTAREREELLIENFVGLQHAMTNLSVKFGSLSDNITKLLQVFEEAARNFVSGGKPDDKDMLNKINSLLDQNKTIAKGLVLMEGKLRGRSEVYGQTPPRPEAERQKPRPLPSR